MERKPDGNPLSPGERATFDAIVAGWENMGAEPQEAGVSSNPGPDFVLYDAPSPSGKTE